MLPAGEAGDQKPYAAYDLKTANVNQFDMPWQIGGHDGDIEAGVGKMVNPDPCEGRSKEEQKQLPDDGNHVRCF